MTWKQILGAVLASAVCMPCELPGADTWTGWLGPRRDGWVAGFQPPNPWPTEIRKDWQVEVGAGYGTPLLAGQRVYQHARQENDEVL